MISYPQIICFGILAATVAVHSQASIGSQNVFPATSSAPNQVLNAAQADEGTDVQLGGRSSLASGGPVSIGPLRPREQQSTLRRWDDANLPSSYPVEPPSLWLNSLDSLRCTQLALTTPGDSSCEGPEAWARAGDGSNGVFFLAVGDTGLLSDGLTSVSNRMAEVCSSLPVTFVSLLGDNFYPSGVTDRLDSRFSTSFDIPFNQASLRHVAFFPILGNHDYRLQPQAQVQHYYAMCPTCKQPQDWNAAKVRWRFPNPWYFSRLVYHNVPLDLSSLPAVKNTKQLQDRPSLSGQPKSENLMTVVNVHLDSNFFKRSRVFTEKQLDFLRKVLQAAATDADWVFVHQHHPLYTDGTPSRNDKTFQKMLLPVFQRYGVDAVFAGHEHLLSHFKMNEPDSGSDPVVQVISGSGSRLHGQNPKCCNPRVAGECGSDVPRCPSKGCIFQDTTHGFVVVELSMKQMRLNFVESETGEVINEATYESKKAARLARAQEGAANATGVHRAADIGYPAIEYISIPKEMTGRWLSQSFWNLWLPIVVVILMLFFFMACWRRCGLFSNVLSKRDFRSVWGRWRRLRESGLGSVELPTVIGSAQPCASNSEEGPSSGGSGPPAYAVLVESPGACELRKQRTEDAVLLS